MCGICGIVNFNAADAVDAKLIARMAGAIAHRGPDDEGFHVRGNAGLGHRRLSIIDLGGGKQPIYNEDGSAVIVFNGEIYNYQEISSELQSLGHRFRTRSDTEAILHGYEQWGERCVEKLRGMFAFAIWDGPAQRLFIARDRLGKKPLYYYQGRDFLAFASEIKALLEVPGVPRELDPAALDLYLSLRYVPGPRTMFREIFKLQPGHWMRLERGQLRIEKYWDVKFNPVERPFDQQLEEFRHLLDESVRLRLISEVPLGVFLSGGLDSSAILASMARVTGGDRVKTFSVGYQTETGAEDDSNEFPYARMAAEKFGADHHEFRVDASDFRDFLPDLVWHLDEPLADPSCIPLYFIAKLAREYITVVLSGEGADEILGGYSIYPKMLAIEQLRSIPLAGTLASAASGLVPHEKLSRYLSQAGRPLEARYRGVCRGVFPAQKQKLLSRIGAKYASNLDDLYGDYFQNVAGASALNRMLYVDHKVWLPDDLLMKADKMTMATALELRVPFLDHKMVEFAATLPDRSKHDGRTGKRLLREAMKGVVPDAILTRPKKGFPVPTQPWLSGQLKDFTHDALLASDSACRRYLNVGALRSLVREHETGRNRHEEMWTLLVFEFWHRMYIDRSISHVSHQPEALVGVAS